MSRPNRQKVIEQLAHVSHAVWMLQAVTDNQRSLKDLEEKIPIKGPGPEEDIGRAQEWLDRVIKGEPLEDISPYEGHHPTDHDRQRAELAIEALDHLGILSG